MKKLLIGLAVVLSLFLIGGLIASAMVYSFFKNNLPDSGPLRALDARHEAEFGEVRDFAPTILESEWAARIDTYVEVRRSLRRPAQAASGVLDRTSEMFASRRFKESSKLSQLRQLIASRHDAIGLARSGAHYLAQRDSLLLEAGMSRGEYAYLDGIVLFAWLSWSPDPEISFEDPKEVQAYDIRLQNIRQEARHLVRGILRNHREALQSVEAPDPDTIETLRLLDEEWTRLRNDPKLFPFEGSLSPGLRAALAPHEAFLRGSLPRTLGETLVEAMAFQRVQIRTGSVDITAY